MQIYQSNVVADFFRSRANPDVGDILSNLKLQKLCYYGAGIIAAVRQNDARPLFSDRIEAWTHGPVVPAQYGRFKHLGADAIPPVEDFNTDQIEARDRMVLDNVYDFYGQYSAWKLRNMTHDEAPWKAAFARENKVITTGELKEFFISEIDQDYMKSYHEAR
ncbi:Panacea domain-containing protein [Rhizobium ruizarguesonis]